MLRVLIVAWAVVLRAGGEHADDEKCVFILSTPGSGSTTLEELLEEYTPCEMSGEDWGALHDLAQFDADMDKTDKMHKTLTQEHDAAAWKGVYNRPDVASAEASLIRAVLNPNGRKCWGFKEIRFGRPPIIATFARDIAFLRSLCAHPRVILHTRRDIASELNSHIIRQNNAAGPTHVQWACFETYMGNTSAIAAHGLSEATAQSVREGCSPPVNNFGGKDGPIAIRHTLEDYLQDNGNHDALWRYLGMEKPKTNTTIYLRTIPKQEKAKQEKASSTKHNSDHSRRRP